MPADSQRLARSVVRLSRRLRQERHTVLTPGQLTVLGTLTVYGPQTPGAIAVREGVQPPTATRIVSSLVDDGFALRSPHPEDGRQVLVTISEKGEALLSEERTRRNEWLSRQLAALDADDRALLRKATVVLEKLAAS